MLLFQDLSYIVLCPVKRRANMEIFLEIRQNVCFPKSNIHTKAIVRIFQESIQDFTSTDKTTLRTVIEDCDFYSTKCSKELRKRKIFTLRAKYNTL